MERPEVLIIDDDKDCRVILGRFLRTNGFRVILARNGDIALAKLTRLRRLVAVLLDVAMPGMDGPTFYQRLRQVRRFRNVRVFVMSGVRQGDVFGDAKGIAGYLRKPFDLNEVLGLLTG